MSERKVLNKYYPPEFDPSKIPKLRVKKTGIFSIRIMAPFNMRCNTCGEYIYKGKKFNSRKENVDDEDYLGLRIFRFYIRCPRCIAEIAFKTDLERTDYALEAGATRLFEAERLAHEMAEKERKEKEEDELNPMKLLENRTKASRNEMEQIDQLEELKEMNVRHARVDHETLLKQHMVYEEQLLKLQEEEEDNLVKAIMGRANSGPIIKRLHDDDDDLRDKVESSASAAKISKPSPGTSNPSDILVDKSVPSAKEDDNKKANVPSWQRSVGSFSKTSLAGLVKKKSTTRSSVSPKPISSSSSSSSSTSMEHSNAQPQSSDSEKSTVSITMVGQNDREDVKVKPSAITGLGLLGDYSDSEESNSD